MAGVLADASPAEAQEGGFTFGGGAYVGVSFGSDHVDVGWGFEAFGMGVIKGFPDGCGSRRRGGLGPSLQLAMVGLSPRVVIAAQGGGEVGRGGVVGLTGELGLAIRPTDETDFGLHLGFVGSGYWAHLLARAAVGLDEYTVGAGPLVNHRGGGTRFGVGPFCSVAGRPLRTDEGALQGASREARALDPVAGAWALDADAELASVPAFVQLAADLLALGAPEELVSAALDAAEDEVRHARLCAAVATRFAGRTVRPRRPSVPRVSPRYRWRRLVLDGWRDGCVGEAAAAETARRAARAATDLTARRAQEVIARDEARHAELAWRVLAWALRQPEGAELVQALRAALGAAPVIEGPARTSAPGAGQLGASAAAEILRAAHADAARRARRLVA